MYTLDSLVILLEKIVFCLMGIFGLGFLIGFHEFGHFLFCKLFGIGTPSFSIGFGPRVFKKKIGDTEFSFSAIPFGGYVEIAGAAEVGQGQQEHAHSRADDSFAVKPYWQKLLVMLGGIICNLLFAYVVFIGLFMAGTPKTSLMYKTAAVPVIAQVLDNKVAQKAGILPGDRIISINNIALESSIEPFLEEMEKSANQPITLTVSRNNNTESFTVTPDSMESMGKTVGSLGVVFELQEGQPHSFGQALRLGIQQTNQWIVNTFNGFTHIFRKRDVTEMAGPLMIIAMTIKGAAQGFKIFLLFLSIISINLAVLNLIPLPILDGGQLLFYSIEALIGRSLPTKVREYIHIITWIAFIILFLYLTCMDLYRILQPCLQTLRATFNL